MQEDLICDKIESTDESPLVSGLYLLEVNILTRLFFRVIMCITLMGTLLPSPLPPEDGIPVPVETVPIIIETSATEPTEAPEPTEIQEPTTEPIPEVTEPESYYSYTEKELDLLARLIFSEGGGESYETKLKIGSVVMNRVEDPKFPNTIREVIYQKSQFSVTVVKIDGVVMIDRPADEESYRAAKEVLDYGSVLPSTVQVFYAIYCKEPWVTSRATYEVSDNTVFAHIYRGG